MVKEEVVVTEKCEDCGESLDPKVMRSAAGYYVGAGCKCGPYARYTGYYADIPDDSVVNFIRDTI